MMMISRTAEHPELQYQYCTGCPQNGSDSIVVVRKRLKAL
jgi:hypothetical protein